MASWPKFQMPHMPMVMFQLWVMIANSRMRTNRLM